MLPTAWTSDTWKLAVLGCGTMDWDWNTGFFHISAAAGQKNSRSNRKRNFGLAEFPKKRTIDDWRMTDDDWRIKEFFLFYYLKEQSVATSTIRQSLFVILRFVVRSRGILYGALLHDEVSYKRRRWPEKFTRRRRAASLIIKKPCHFGVVSYERLGSSVVRDFKV